MPRTKSPKKTNGETTVAPVETAASPVPAATAITNAEPTKKPTIVASNPAKVATDGRAKLVPINVEDEVRRLAYLLSERRGFEPGHEAEDWLNAEREVRERYHQQSA